MKTLILFLLLTIAVSAQTLVDNLNSSTSTQIMDSDSMWTGTRKFLTDWSYVTVKVRASHASAVNGFVVQFSNDGTTWVDSVYTSVSANEWVVHSFVPELIWYRVRYTNGSDSLTSFTLQSVMHKNNIEKAYNRILVRDTIYFMPDTGSVRGDSILYINPNFQFKQVDIIKEDTLVGAAGAALLDSVWGEYYDPYSAKWDTLQFVNPYGDRSIIITNTSGTIRTWKIDLNYPYRIRLKLINYWKQYPLRKAKITVVGKND